MVFDLFYHDMNSFNVLIMKYSYVPVDVADYHGVYTELLSILLVLSFSLIN